MLRTFSAHLLAAGLLLAGSGGAPVCAADASLWTITIGVKAGVMPDYAGSNAYIFRPSPLIDIRKAGDPDRFHSPRESIVLGLYEQGGFRAGPAAKLRFPRYQGDDKDLQGLGDVGWGIEVGGFAEYWLTDWLRAHTELRQGFGAHYGITSETLIDAVVPVTTMITLSAGPRLTIASQKAVAPYFDVTAAQSAASGLPVYRTGGGITSWGVGTQARYVPSPMWATFAYVEYVRLAGDVAGAPIVAMRGSRDQFDGGIGVTYSFNVPALWR